MKMYIKESYVHKLPLNKNFDGPTRWVSCNGEDCGYARNATDSNYQGKLLRMFKVNGEQICQACLEEWYQEIYLALLQDDVQLWQDDKE